ncbi:hypothetical protein FOA52_015083 [Chlamydomonas sp. UWO 241]|nr:hypothetical protein FOA52_015083 [Chlamydomonas sp. UWO 241]
MLEELPSDGGWQGTGAMPPGGVSRNLHAVVAPAPPTGAAHVEYTPSPRATALLSPSAPAEAAAAAPRASSSSRQAAAGARTAVPPLPLRLQEVPLLAEVPDLDDDYGFLLHQTAPSSSGAEHLGAPAAAAAGTRALAPPLPLLFQEVPLLAEVPHLEDYDSLLHHLSSGLAQHGPPVLKLHPHPPLADEPCSYGLPIGRGAVGYDAIGASYPSPPPRPPRPPPSEHSDASTAGTGGGAAGGGAVGASRAPRAARQRSVGCASYDTASGELGGSGGGSGDCGSGDGGGGGGSGTGSGAGPGAAAPPPGESPGAPLHAHARTGRRPSLLDMFKQSVGIAGEPGPAVSLGGVADGGRGGRASTSSRAGSPPEGAHPRPPDGDAPTRTRAALNVGFRRRSTDDRRPSGEGGNGGAVRAFSRSVSSLFSGPGGGGDGGGGGGSSRQIVGRRPSSILRGDSFGKRLTRRMSSMFGMGGEASESNLSRPSASPRRQRRASVVDLLRSGSFGDALNLITGKTEEEVEAPKDPEWFTSMDEFRPLEFRTRKAMAQEQWFACAKISGEHFVLKMYKKGAMSVTETRSLKRMLTFAEMLQHEHLVKLRGSWEDDDHIYVVEDYIIRGDLLSDSMSHPERYTEMFTARFVVEPLLRVLCYLHGEGVIHRSITLEHLLLGRHDCLHLGHFVDAINLKQDVANGRIAFLDYMAPEMLSVSMPSDPEAHRISRTGASFTAARGGGRKLGKRHGGGSPSIKVQAPLDAATAPPGDGSLNLITRSISNGLLGLRRTPLGSKQLSGLEHASRSASLTAGAQQAQHALYPEPMQAPAGASRRSSAFADFAAVPMVTVDSLKESRPAAIEVELSTASRVLSILVPAGTSMSNAMSLAMSLTPQLSKGPLVPHNAWEWVEAYDEKVDIWQVGCTLHELLVGCLPFETPDADLTAALILWADISVWPDSLSPECIDFMEQCLTKDPSKRPSAADLLRHPWVVRMCAGESLPTVRMIAEGRPPEERGWVKWLREFFSLE